MQCDHRKPDFNEIYVIFFEAYSASRVFGMLLLPNNWGRVSISSVGGSHQPVSSCGLCHTETLFKAIGSLGAESVGYHGKRTRTWTLMTLV